MGTASRIAATAVITLSFVTACSTDESPTRAAVPTAEVLVPAGHPVFKINTTVGWYALMRGGDRIERLQSSSYTMIANGYIFTFTPSQFITDTSPPNTNLYFAPPFMGLRFQVRVNSTNYQLTNTGDYIQVSNGPTIGTLQYTIKAGGVIHGPFQESAVLQDGGNFRFEDCSINITACTSC